MVKKLLKYEFTAMLRKQLPLILIVLGTAALNRILQFFESGHSTYQILFWSSAVLLAVSCVVLTAGTLWIIVSRFYKNMYTNEGYLTLSLPVTADQHLFCKLLTAVCCSVIAVLTCMLAASLAMVWDMLWEVVKAGRYLFRQAAGVIGKGHLSMYTLEFAIAMILNSCKTILVLYACVSLGQLGKKNKNRPARAVGFFFIYYFAVQALGTIIVIIFAVLELSGVLEAVGEWIAHHARAFIHLLLCFGILWSAGFSVLYYWICRHVLTKKLNLE